MTTLDELLKLALPLNRKERYYTATVLPALLCSDDFTHLHRLTELLPIQALDVRASPDDCTVLFFTEYGIAESAVGAAAERFAGLPTGRDTPDVVILVTEPKPVLIALEAKLYDRPSRPEMLKQLQAQRVLLEPLAERLSDWLRSEPVSLVHAALLPDELAEALGDIGVPVLTWTQLRDTFENVAPPYFEALLTIAIARYGELVSRWAGNQDAELSGAWLVRRHLEGDLAYPWMGRGGGLDGERLKQDLATGRWRSFEYQCARREVKGNPNWFAVADFVALLQRTGSLP